MYFNSIQVLRGIAALAVVLYHANVWLLKMGYNEPTILNIFDVRFSFGARLFFVVSGFLMAYLIDINYKYFLPRRLLRIYPTYLIAVILYSVFRYLIAGSMPNAEIFLTSTLLPLGSNLSYPLHVEWTLIYEVFFYFICSVFAINSFKKYFLKFLFIWMGITLVSFFLFPTATSFRPTLTEIFFSLFNMLFILGGFTYHAYKKFSGKFHSLRYPILLIGILIFYISCIVTQPSVQLLINGISFSLIIISLLATEKELKISKNSFLKKFGDYSYGLYLIHVPVILLVYRFLGPNTMSGFIALVISLLIGWCFGSLDVFIHERIKTMVFSKQPAKEGMNSKI